MTPENHIYIEFSKGKSRSSHRLNNNLFPKHQIEKPLSPIFLNNSYLDNKRGMKRPSLPIKRK
jgi:hypothetical protein